MSFTPKIEALPQTLPVFPLSGVVLLPRARLPLNVFEPRYLALVEDALAGGRLFGMVQMQTTEGDKPPLYQIGCAGRIASFSETEDGRMLLTLIGVARFRIEDEIATMRGYRRIVPDWRPFKGDVSEREETSPNVDRGQLISALKPYFRSHEISANWESIAETSDEKLVNSLTMICPFEPAEKQALLEAPNLEARAKLLYSLLAMGAADPLLSDVPRH